MMADEKHKLPTEQEQIESLRQANVECLARTKPLLKMLGICKQQFALYAENHKAKATEDGDQKAGVNLDFVKQIETTLADFRDREKPLNPEG